jgi:hypothetical protein
MTTTKRRTTTPAETSSPELASELPAFGFLTLCAQLAHGDPELVLAVPRDYVERASELVRAGLAVADVPTNGLSSIRLTPAGIARARRP